MRAGDKVIYKEKKAVIVEIKWGLCCIKFTDTLKQIWVTQNVLKRHDL